MDPFAGTALFPEAQTELGAAVRSWAEDLLREWREASDAKSALGGMTEEEKIDHTPHLLAEIVRVLESQPPGRPTSSMRESAAQYALGRMAESVELGDCLGELEELRSLVLHFWWSRRGPPQHRESEAQALDRALDVVVREVVEASATAERRTLSALDRLTATVLETLPVEELLRKLLTIVVESISVVDTAAIFLLEGERVVLRAAVGMREEEVDVFAMKVGEGFAGQVAATRQPRFTPSAATDPELHSRALRERGTRALYGVPLIASGRLVGVATAGSLTQSTFSRLTELVLRALSERAADVIAYRLLQSERERLSLEYASAAEVAQAKAAGLDAAIEAITDGILLYDGAGAIVRSNEAARRLFGYGDEEYSMPVEDRIGRAEARQSSGEPFTPQELPGMRALRGETVRGVPMSIRSPRTGQTMLVSAGAAPIPGPRGAPIGAVATFADVSRIQQLQQRQEDLLRMVSHDVRTPLSTISMQAHLLKKAPGDAEAVVRRAEAIGTSCQSAERMIQELVEMSRLETGKLALDLRTLELGSWLKELISRLEGVFETARLRLRAEGEVPPVEADPARLERAIVNLVSNAFKYAPAETPVEIEVRKASSATEVCVAVRDHGPGIAPEDLPRIFDRYYRSPTRAAASAEGLGLGLYITRLLVEAHRGRISAQSAPGAGSTFTVWLPVGG